MSKNDIGITESRGCKKPKLLRIIMASSIVAILFASSLSLLSIPSSENQPAPARISYTSHGVIYISGNAQFTAPNGVTGGTGIVSDPYVISGWDIDATLATGIFIQATTAYFVIRDCYIHTGGAMNSGICIFNCVNGVLDNNTCPNSFYGIEVLYSPDHITVINNACSNNLAGIYLYYTNNTSIINNTCSSNFNGGIFLDSSTSNFLSNNTCSNNQVGIQLSSSANNILSSNFCTGSEDGIEIISSSGNVVDDNACTSSSDYGIFVYSSSNSNIISNNTFKTGWVGIFVQSANNNIIRDNNCTGNNQDGISLYLWNNGNVLVNNTCSSNPLRGIYLDSSSNNTISDNTCNLNGDYGIYLYSAGNNTISDNTCNLNVNYGIYIRSSFNSTLSNNSCHSNTLYGIALMASNNSTLSGNNCSLNDDGIDIWDSSGCTLSDNYCESTMYGIYLSTSSNNTVSNNDCSSVSWYGIYLTSSSNDNMIRDNNCSYNDEGIYLESSNGNTLVNNTCSSNNYYGIHLESSSNDNMIRDNNCSDNDEGMYLESSSYNTLEDNICNSQYVGINLESSSNYNMLINNSCLSLRNGSDGIDLYSSSYNTLINNNCSGGWKFIYIGWNGIYLGSVSDNNTLINNDCSNGYYGIYLDGSSNNTVANNICSSNDGNGITARRYGSGLNKDNKDNEISRNIICNNVGYGVKIESASNNHVWNNTLIGNNGTGSVYNSSRHQAFDDGTNNSWNSTNGYGNYWGDWLAPDNDMNGIVDVPFIINGSAGAKDYYPLTFLPEDIAPVTTAASVGTTGGNGWFRSNASVSLSATDAGSGVNATFYRVGTSGGWLGYSSAFIISSDGNHTVQFYSVDNAGNIESVKNISVRIDRTAPTLTINQTAGFEATVNYAVISWIGTDATTGIEHFEVSIDGGAFVSVGMEMSHNFSGLADGSHNVTVKAIDAAGNEVNKTIQFTVDTSAPSGGSPSSDLVLYGAIIAIIVVIIVVALVIMMRKKKSPPAETG